MFIYFLLWSPFLESATSKLFYVLTIYLVACSFNGAIQMKQSCKCLTYSIIKRLQVNSAHSDIDWNCGGGLRLKVCVKELNEVS